MSTNPNHRPRVYLNKCLSWCVAWTGRDGRRTTRPCGKGAAGKALALQGARDLAAVGAELPAPDVVVRGYGQ
jgi:hypothetical protein